MSSIAISFYIKNEQLKTLRLALAFEDSCEFCAYLLPHLVEIKLKINIHFIGPQIIVLYVVFVSPQISILRYLNWK